MAVSWLAWIEHTGFFTSIRESPYAYPALLALHMVSLIALGGMIVVTDLRLLGVGMRSFSVSDVVDGFRIPKRVSFAFAAACGALLFGAKAAQYAYNRWFWIKLGFLALIGLNYLIFRRAAFDNAARSVRNAKLASTVSLLLWAGVVLAARGPASVKDIMHSMVDPAGDFLFQSVQTIADEHGIREKSPHTGEEWDNVRQRVNVLLKAPDLLVQPGRLAARPRDRSKNPEVEDEPDEIQRLINMDRRAYEGRAQKLREAASVAMKAVAEKNKDALLRALDGIDKACEGCHVRYWYPKDQRAVEAARQDGLIP